VDLFLVGSSVNNLSSRDSDADVCLMFKDRPDRMDQTVAAAKLLEKVNNLIAKDSEYIYFNCRTEE
jgi:DNA polymerase sigma